MDLIHKRGAPQAKLFLVKKRYNMDMTAVNVKDVIPAGTPADLQQEIKYIVRGIQVSNVVYMRKPVFFNTTKY